MSFRIVGIERIYDNGDLVTVVTKNAVIHLPDRMADTKHHITLGTGENGEITHMFVDLDQDELGLN